MQFHQLKSKTKRKTRKRIGRGGKRGTYSGKGRAGQKARSSPKLKPLIREVIKRYPKLRGYRYRRKEQQFAIVNVGALEKEFKENQKINPELLLKKRLIRRIKGRIPQVKILGKGKIRKPLVIEKCQLSKIAKEKIEKASGKILCFFKE